MICPNISLKEVKDGFNEMVEALGGRPLTDEEFKSSELRNQRTGQDYSAMEAAYRSYHRNNGNMLDKAPNGNDSVLFNSLLEHFGNRAEAIKAKANVYTDEFFNWFGDWTGESAVFDDDANVVKIPIESLNTEIKKFKHSLYRGQGYEPELDEDGNLILHTNWDQLGKVNTLSFDKTLKGAFHYGHRAAKNPYIIEIDEDYLDTILPKKEYNRSDVENGKRFRYDEEFNEVRLSFDGQLIIPKDKFNIRQNQEELHISTIDDIFSIVNQIASLEEQSEI